MAERNAKILYEYQTDVVNRFNLYLGIFSNNFAHTQPQTERNQIRTEMINI